MTTSNPFAMLGDDDGFQQVPSKKNKKKKSKAHNHSQAAESPVTVSSAPSEVSEDITVAPTAAFQQVKAGKAKATQQQQGRDPDVIRNEEQAAAEAHSEHLLQDLFSHWESSMEQTGAGRAYTEDRSRMCFREALIHSSAIDSALGQILSLPEPSAVQQRLASFLEALMHGQVCSVTPGTLAAAVVKIAASARKDGGQEFGSDARSAIRTVSLALRHMTAQAAAPQAFRDHSEEDMQVVQQCRAKQAALKSAQSTEEKLHLARDLHSLCAKRLEFSGRSTSSIVEPMQQLSAWQNKLQQHVEEATMSRSARKAALTQEEASLCSEAATLQKELEELQQRLAGVNGQLQRIASRRKQIAVALPGKAPDQAKPTEHMQEELRAAANLKAALDAMVSNEAPAAALQEVLQPAGAYADSMIALLTCTAASAAEEEAHMQLLERGRQAARHVKNAQLAVQQVEGMASKEQREKLRPSALTALEGRERELKGIRRAADSMATSTEKSAAEFSAKKDQLSIPADKVAQAADLLKSVRGALSAIAAGPEPASEPVKSEKTGKREKKSVLSERNGGAANSRERSSGPKPEAKSASPAPQKREPRPPQNNKLTAAEARKRAGFDVKEKDAPAWMQKPASSVPARPQPRPAANGHVPQASKPVTPQKPVSYAQLLNGHTTAPASAHADTDTTTEEESIADVQTTSEKSTPPKDGDKASKLARDMADIADAGEDGAESQPADSRPVAARVM